MGMFEITISWTDTDADTDLPATDVNYLIRYGEDCFQSHEDDWYIQQASYR